MSEKKKINDDMIFQSFSKNYIFESNKEQNKTSKNEIIEFSFKKNLFLQKSEDNNNTSNNFNSNSKQISLSGEHNYNIYSKNDTNIQESGHFGKSKYDSKNYKSLIENNAIKKEPLFYIEEKFNRMKEEEEENKNSKNIPTFPNNNSNSCLINTKYKKIQIIRKKKGIRNNNSTHHNHIKKTKDDSFFSSKNHEQKFLYKKKITNNNINLNCISNIRDNSYERCKANNTLNKICHTISINEIPNYNKIEYCNIYRNTNQNKKIINSKSNNINPKLKTIINNSNYIFKSLKDNKENIQTNYSNIIFNNQNINNIIINNNFCPNLGNIKLIDFEPEKTYRNMHKMNKSSNKVSKNNNIEKLKNEFKIKNTKKNNVINSSTTCLGLMQRKKLKQERNNKNKNNNISYNGNGKLININNKVGLYKARTHKSRLDNKKEKCIPNGKAINKIKILKERFLNCYFEKHCINYYN